MNTLKIELRYSDSDQMGVVYHANYFSFFEMGRTNYLKQNGIKYYDIEKRGYLFPLRKVECEYLKAITLDETIYCETEIIEMTKIKIIFSHRLMNDKNDLKAIGQTTVVCVDKESFNLARIDKNLPDVYRLKE
jgi:acyl-CoA thioester hydrolase